MVKKYGLAIVIFFLSSQHQQWHADGNSCK
jgi:hypothetical protein